MAQERKPWGTIGKEGAVAALGWGAAVGTVHLGAGIGLIVSMGMPPMTWFAAKSILLEVSLAFALGLVTIPVRALPRGAALHPILLMLAWIGMEYSVAVDPTKPVMWLVPSLVAGVIYALMSLAARKSRAIPVALGVVMPAVLLSVPVINQSATGVVATDPKRGTAPAGAPDILYVVLDTVRADSVSAYGYERQTTPRFDAFAKEGVLFTEATAPGTWSLPAHGSLFTGTFPSVNNTHAEHRYLDDKLPTLAEALAAQGYETLCFTANTHITDNFGLTRGFAWSDQAWITGAGGRGFSFIYRFLDTLGFAAEDKGGRQVVTNVKNWLDSRPADAPPAFVFVNILEAHFPFHQLPDEFLFAYTKHDYGTLRDASLTAFGLQFGRQVPDSEREALRSPMIDMYDAGVRYSDHLFGEILDAWAEKNGLDDTVIVVLADHGEMVGEHGAYGHMMSVYQQDLHVPLAIRYPKRIAPGSQVDVPISTVGSFATVFDLIGMTPPASVQVGSLLPAIEGRTAGLPAMSERFEEHMLSARFEPGTANGSGPLLQPHGRYRVYREGDWKLVQNKEGDVFLFNLATDPGENHDLAATAVAERGRLENELAVWKSFLRMPDLHAEVIGGAVPEIDAAALEQLKALGYVE